jgi:hypothetical protein
LFFYKYTANNRKNRELIFFTNFLFCIFNLIEFLKFCNTADSSSHRFEDDGQAYVHIFAAESHVGCVVIVEVRTVPVKTARASTVQRTIAVAVVARSGQNAA